MKIKVTIEETLRREVEVDGVMSVAEAVEKVKKGYAAEDYVLGAEDHVETEIYAAKGETNRVVITVKSGLLCRVLASDPKLDVTIVDHNVQDPDDVAEYAETMKALEAQVEAGALHVIK